MLAAYGQESDEESEEVVIELLPLNYTNAEYGFGIALPDGYTTFEGEAEGTWFLQITGEIDQPMAALSIEALPDGVTDVAGFWQAMKDRDSMMARNITYEKVGSIANTGAIQARIEKIENGEYILAITWVFVHDGYGYSLSGYPPPGGDNDNARDIALEIAQQFRWMTAEEIAASEAVEPEPESENETGIDQGQEF